MSPFNSFFSNVRNFFNTKCGEIWCNRIADTKVFVQTTYGPIVGFQRKDSTHDYDYIYFKGIPYAKPPIGPLRFKAPEPPEPWTEPPLRFSRGGSLCSQQVNNTFIGDEDCLHLYVYTRTMTPITLAPVMVCIHGGTFTDGSISSHVYNPEYLLYHGIVFVAINYRLGAFGFLALKDPKLEVPGNAGLKDQCLALKWVKENIRTFGGNPDNITLFGTGAGAVSTHFHCISDMSKGLFHKAMILSGNIHSEWTKHCIHSAVMELTAYFGMDELTSEEELLKFLQSCSSEAIVEAQHIIVSEYHKDQFILNAFGPAVETYVSDQCFLPISPLVLARNCWSKSIPVIIGYVTHEGLAFPNLLHMNGSVESSAPNYEFGIPYQSLLGRHTSLLVRKFYFGYTDPTSKANILTKQALLTDKFVLHALHRDILLRASDHNFGPTYIYRFSHVPTKGVKRWITTDNAFEGTVHGDDMKYYLKAAIEPLDYPEGHREYDIRQRMTSIFATFARNGNPNNEIIAQEYWEPLQSPAIDYTTGEPIYTVLDIADNLRQIQLPEKERMYFWDCLYTNLDCPLI